MEATETLPMPALPVSIKEIQTRALSVLEKYGIIKEQNEDYQLAGLLQKVVDVDQGKVLVIANILKDKAAFNKLMINNVQEMNFGERYLNISDTVESIRADSKKLMEQLENDGIIDWKENIANKWMKMLRGTPNKRFFDLMKIFDDVSKDTQKQLDAESEILNAYEDYRTTLKYGEGVSRELLALQEANLRTAQDEFNEAHKTVLAHEQNDAKKSELELARDQKERFFKEADKKYQLIKDVSEALTVGYNVGKAMMKKLEQTHDSKERVHTKAVTFFDGNREIFTMMAAVYGSQYGLHEMTQVQKRMEDAFNKGLEDIAEVGDKLEREGLKEGYGPSINPDSLRRLIDSITTYQTETNQEVLRLRQESTAAVAETTKMTEEGEKKSMDARLAYQALPA